MVRQTVTDLGGVDILVNNAGIATTELVEDLDEEKWRGAVAMPAFLLAIWKDQPLLARYVVVSIPGSIPAS